MSTGPQEDLAGMRVESDQLTGDARTIVFAFNYDVPLKFTVTAESPIPALRDGLLNKFTTALLGDSHAPS